jgi:hypothetical protein
MHSDTSQIRGFNYIPGYAGTLQTIWTHFDAGAWDREVQRSLRFGTNTLRVWLDWQAWLADGNRFIDSFEAALSIVERHGIQMMPVLFNRWNDANAPMGMVTDRDLQQSDYTFRKFQPYLDTLLLRFGDDGRICLWDLCNEPQAPREHSNQVNLKEYAWLSYTADTVRRFSKTPLTIGTMVDESVALYAPLADILSFHPYTNTPGHMDELCRTHLAIAQHFRKPLICTEACRGSFDDHERGTQARDDVETLIRHGIGWTLWHLCEGKFVTACHERVDNNSLHPNQGYMPFILADGNTRPGHEWLERSFQENTKTNNP